MTAIAFSFQACTTGKQKMAPSRVIAIHFLSFIMSTIQKFNHSEETFLWGITFHFDKSSVVTIEMKFTCL